MESTRRTQRIVRQLASNCLVNFTAELAVSASFFHAASFRNRLIVKRIQVIFGVLNINKPKGITSRAVVNHVDRLCPKSCRVGHAGTLDPLATGVLVVAVGPATKLIQYSQRSAKGYVGEFRSGFQSDTEDVTGTVSEVADARTFDEAELRAALLKFTGLIEQTPPQFSAVRVDGRRAYKVARAGKPVAIDSRPTMIHALELLEYSPPDFEIAVRCGKGTYIRTLGRDIAKSLGSDAVMTKLKRTAVGDFSLTDSIELQTIQADTLHGCLLDPKKMVTDLDYVTLQPADIERIGHGIKIKLDDREFTKSSDASNELAAFNEQQQLLAVLERRGENQWASRVNFVPLLSG